jgi:putative transposase
LAARHTGYGYLFLHEILKTEGLVINKKRTYRLYTEEGLQVRTKQRRKLQRPCIPMSVPPTINERWSMDFVTDQLSNGRRFRVLNVEDDYSQEVIGQLVSVSITGH